MNHEYIEEHQIADRYVMGTLTPDEAERFEDHYLSCPQCLDRLSLAESMQRGFKRAAGQDVAQLAATRQLALVAWLVRLGRSRQIGVLATGLLVVAVVALPGGLALRRSATLDRELAETRRALEQERQRPATGPSTVPPSTTAEIEKLRAELEASRRDLAREQEERTRAAEQLARSRLPQMNVPILDLDTVRSGGPGEEPTHRLRRPPSDTWVVLSLQLDPPLEPSYQAILRNDRGREIWRGTGLRPNEIDCLNLSLPSSLLEPGDYTVVVDGSRFTFRVL